MHRHAFHIQHKEPFCMSDKYRIITSIIVGISAGGTGLFIIPASMADNPFTWISLGIIGLTFLFLCRPHPRSAKASIPMSDVTIIRTLSDPSASNWLKSALETAMNRDPVDAANDASHLAELLNQRADASLRAKTTNITGRSISTS